MIPFYLVLKIEKSERYEEVFGQNVVSALHREITEALKKITAQLLSRCDTGSDIQSPSFGLWFLAFSFRSTDLPVDTEEQRETIRAAGEEMVRDMLKREMGMATGCKVDFSLAVIPAPSDSMDATAISRYLAGKLESTGAAAPPLKIGRDNFMEIIETGQIETWLQPIVSLPDEKIVGYEALSRGPKNGPVHAAADLFGTAVLFNAREEAELACFAMALTVVPKLPEPFWMSLNLAPHLMESKKFLDMADKIPENHLSRVVLEMTEHLPISTADRLQRTVGNLKDMGIRFALDDTGCGFADMDTVRIFRPEIVKLCITVVRRIGQHPKIEEDIRETVKRVSNLGGKVLGEGVEKKEQAEILKACGVSLAQGFHYARPMPAEEMFNPLA